MLPPGRYTSYVSATDGTLTASQAVSFEADAFYQRLTDATPARGQTVTIYVTSAEPLSATAPRAYVYEPGLAAWRRRPDEDRDVYLPRDAGLEEGRSQRYLDIKILGTDSKGQVQRTTRTYP